MTQRAETAIPRVVKTREAAAMIGGSRSTVYRLLRSGELKAVKRGAAILVLTDSIFEHMESLPPALFSAARAA